MSDAKHRMRSYGIGHLLGLAGVPRPMIAKREPVAYLYNGVRLPKLPESDLPYALIVTNYGYGTGVLMNRQLFLSDSPITITSDGCVIPAPLKIYYFRYDYAKCEWNYNSTRDEDPYTYAIKASRKELLWTSHDIIDTVDSSVYLAASKPVPDEYKPMLGYALYNEIGLPNIDQVWTDELKVQYPYACLYYDVSSNAITGGSVLFLIPELSYHESGSAWMLTVDSALQFKLNVFNGWYESDGHLYGIQNRGLDWANFDIQNKDGTVCLAASEPIPVYE